MSGKVHEIRRALERAHRAVWQTQRPDGSWDAPGDLGPWVTAQVTVALHHVGALDPADARELGRWLRAQQRKDGAFVLHPFAQTGELGATACGWAALHVIRTPEDSAAAAQARAWVDTHGGLNGLIDRMAYGDSSAVFVALAGLLDAHRLPCPVSAPLMFRPLTSLLATRFHSGVFMRAMELEVIIRALRGGLDAVLAKVVAGRCVATMKEFQNRDGSWNDSAVISVLALPALKAAGLRPSDPTLAQAIGWMLAQRVRDAQGLHFDGFSTEVWATAFNVRALLSSGVSASDPDIERALDWLCRAQLDIPMPQVDNRQRGAQLHGGWAFQRTNHTLPDCDDAGVVLTSLGLALEDEDAGPPPALQQRLRGSIAQGQRWLFDMQNPDGGWAAFVWGLPGKPPGAIMKSPRRMSLQSPFDLARLLIDPSGDAGDPSTEDLTARVLHGLGHTGYSAADPRIARAIEFLRVQQCDTGAWWGRWVVNYLSATAFVLMGLKAVHADLGASWVRKAVRWMTSRQNDDGGFGEGPESYRDEGMAGRGKSLPPLTSLVVQALVDVGEGGSQTCARAVQWLLREQRSDGSFPNGDYLHTNVPPETFYFYPEAARFYPIEALGKVLAFQQAPAPAPVPERWSDALLDAMRQRTDPIADAAVAEILDTGQTVAVNALLSTLFRSDDPLPAGLPDAARRYFEQTEALPGWAQAEKIAAAQQLFTRAGWEIAAGLFCSSLPQAYAAANGATVIAQTQGMTRHVRQRILETAQFLFDVVDEGALEPEGRGVRTVQKVRLMHAAIRHLLITRPQPKWDAQRLGLPVNQEDLAGTLMTFSAVTLDAMKRLGVEVHATEAEGWLHLWKVVGHLMGIEAQLLPADLIEADLLMDAIRDRQWAPSPEGRALIAPLIQMMDTYFPGQLLDGIPVALVRYLAGDHCADTLGLPAADWTRVLVGVAAFAGELIDDPTPGDRLSRLFAVASHRLMEAVVLTEREGKHAQFRIPSCLKHTVVPQRLRPPRPPDGAPL